MYLMDAVDYNVVVENIENGTPKIIDNYKAVSLYHISYFWWMGGGGGG